MLPPELEQLATAAEVPLYRTIYRRLLAMLPDSAANNLRMARDTILQYPLWDYKAITVTGRWNRYSLFNK